MLDIGPQANGKILHLEAPFRDGLVLVEDFIRSTYNDTDLMNIGTIVAIEQDNLRAAGAWIKSHGEAIFNTTYWTITPEEGLAVRFTQTLDAFYISTLYAPNSTLVLNSPVPYLSGDQVTVVGGNLSGTVVPSELLANGSLRLSISDEVKAADQYTWVFKVAFDGANGTSGSNSTGGGIGTSSASHSMYAMLSPVIALASSLLFLWF